MTRPVVLVLAGGASNRFWPLRDKPLVELGSQTLLERHVRLLNAAGCERFIVVARPDTASQIEVIGAAIDLDPRTGAGPEVRVVLQAEPRGMADAVLSARTLLEELGDTPVYVTQAQDVVEGRLHAELLDSWDRTPGLTGLIAAQRVKDYFPGGYLTLEGQRVTSVVEKPGAGNEPSDLVNLVAHLHASARRLLQALEEEAARDSATDDAYERALSRLMGEGDFRASVYEGRWQALKYPWHLLDVADMLLDLWTRGEESPGRDYEQREDGVFIGRDVRIFPGAYLVPPALIGHDSVIGHNSLVRASIVGPGSVVGFGSEVARSVLFEGVELHHNYVGDSVFDRESAMGYGAVTANFRIDDRTVPSTIGGERIDSARMKLGLMTGAGVRIGVNTSTMPGVKIGAGAMIGPNINITRDVPDGARVLDEGEYGRF